jgi:hypothetical protein
VRVQLRVFGHLFPHDLFFEQRPQDDRRRAGVFETTDGVERVGQGEAPGMMGFESGSPR